MKRTRKILLSTLIAAILLFVVLILYVKSSITLNPPKIELSQYKRLTVVKPETDFYIVGNNWLKKSKSGLWELYVEGKPAERGIINGMLSKALIKKQESAFINQIRKLVPSDFYLSFLKYFVGWFNRDIDKHIPPEYLAEIYGLSLSAAEDYSFIGSNYERILNYHAAHDIGHALENMKMVGCTSFSAWNTRTEDHSLIIGRNFDFYVGDEFAENKIVMFCKPDSGYKFMMVTWGGMIGAVSGMNIKGLTVTLNAAKSSIPHESKTPISIIAREILQYARNIEEAFVIAKKRMTFVSEAIMIGSLENGKTAIIEKTPEKTELFYSKEDFIICSNHFQSDSLKNTESNLENIRESNSKYRYDRVLELIGRYKTLNIRNTAEILRNRQGLKDINLGMGNENAINQLIAHHSVIFNPNKMLVWVSTNPYQLGEYVCYDLNKVFKEAPGLRQKKEIMTENLNIPADDFLETNDYLNYKAYRRSADSVNKAIHSGGKMTLSQEFINRFSASNPDYYGTYSLIGDYYSKSGANSKAAEYYKLALSKEVSSKMEKDKILEKIKPAK